MRLQNIVALTHAELLNSPYVSEFEKIVFEPRKVKRGDLFVAQNSAHINEAISNGAYAILFDKPTQISDSEVAWLRVQSLDDALLRLLRFRLIELEVEAFLCDEITLELAKSIETFGEVIVVDGQIAELTQKLWDIQPQKKLLFCPTKTSPDLFANAKEFSPLIKERINLIDKTLFEVSFIFDNRYYEEMLLAPFFLPFLEKLLNFYKSHGITFKLKEFSQINHFQICFTNKNLEIIESGASQRVLIFEKNLDLVAMQMEFLQNHAPWAKLIFVVPKSFAIDATHSFSYSNEEEILEILEQEDFHFALIAGVGCEILNKSKKILQPKQLTFDML